MDEYIKNLLEEVDRKTRSVLEDAESVVGSVSSSSSSAGSDAGKASGDGRQDSRDWTLAKLKVDGRLEDRSKSRIGTFERIYSDVFVAETGKPLAFGYADLDFSPLVSMLCCVLEIEMNESVYRLCRKLSGYGSFAGNYRPRGRQNGSQNVDFSQKTQTFGALAYLFREYAGKMDGFISDAQSAAKLFSSFVRPRNDASHSKFVSRDEFLDFYGRYSSFFNRYVGELMDIKDRLRRDAGSDRAFGSGISRFGVPGIDPADEDYIASVLSGEGVSGRVSGKDTAAGSASVSENIVNKVRNGTNGAGGRGNGGVIFTDCAKLAFKYFGSADRKVADPASSSAVSAVDFVKGVISGYAERCRSFGVEYVVLDVSESRYTGRIGNNSSWRDYLAVLDSFCAEYGIGGDEVVRSLFIVGGNDVVPMPTVLNPSSVVSDSVYAGNVAEHDVDSDMLYSYPGEMISMDRKGLPDMGRLLSSAPRFVVGRLPMEDGFMDTDFLSDVAGYFSRALDAYASSGLRLKSMPVVTCCDSCSEVSRMVMEGIPFTPLADAGGFVKGGMICSPAYEMDRLPVEGNANGDRLAGVCMDAQISADMLVFMLHGTYVPKSPEYFGEDKGKTRSFKAFHSDCFRFADAGSVAGICCYGARFIGYRRSDSSLLQSVYNKTLMFMGSSRSAFGVFDMNLPEVGNRITGAELLMHYYLKNLMSGMEGGYALFKAKMDYVTGHVEKENIPCLLTSVLEFNFFGDPMLRLAVGGASSAEGAEDGFRAAMFRSPDSSRVLDSWTSVEYRTVFSRDSAYGRETGMPDVRALVDENLSGIHSVFAEKLYGVLGVKPRDLYCVKEYNDRSSGKLGFTYGYCIDRGAFRSHVIADVDSCGNVNSVMESF